MDKLYTIGFTQKTAQSFFMTLAQKKVTTLIDIRLNNTSQLAGFAKAKDLKYFLAMICGISYRHEPLLAPTDGILYDYRKKKITWTEYEEEFLELLKARKVEEVFGIQDLNMSCLLCSEPVAIKCHRRLVANYFQEYFNSLEIIHL